jgi:uncharacterized membrane protein/ribosomal protein L40E
MPLICPIDLTENPDRSLVCAKCGAKLTSIQPGQKFSDGRFLIRSRLREDQFSLSFMAEDLNARSNCVLREFFSSNPNDPQLKKRFVAVAKSLQSAASLSLRILYPFTREDRFYTVSDPSAGPTLREELASSGPVSPEVAKQWLASILRELKALHDASVFHGSLSSDRVFLGSDGSTCLADPVFLGYLLGDGYPARPLMIEKDLRNAALIGLEMVDGKPEQGDIAERLASVGDLELGGTLDYLLLASSKTPRSADQAEQLLTLLSQASSEGMERAILLYEQAYNQSGSPRVQKRLDEKKAAAQAAAARPVQPPQSATETAGPAAPPPLEICAKCQALLNPVTNSCPSCGVPTDGISNVPEGRPSEVLGQPDTKVHIAGKETQGTPGARWHFTPRLALLVIVPTLALIYWLSVRRPPGEVTVRRFQLSRQEIVAGEPVTLSWNVEGPAKVDITPGIGPVANGGEQIVRPAQETVYTLHATDSAGRVFQATSRIAVLPKPVETSILRFQVSQQAIVVGDEVTLTWSVRGPTKTIEIKPDVGNVANEGQQHLIPTADTVYTIQATDPAGRVHEAKSRIAVRPKPAKVSNDKQSTPQPALASSAPKENLPKAEDSKGSENEKINDSFNKSQQALAAALSNQYHIIRMRNDCAVGTITVAIRFQSLDRTWATQGWWHLDPHAERVASSASSRNGLYYFYATGSGRTWSGKAGDPNAIDIMVVDDLRFTQIGPIPESMRGQNPRMVKALRKDYLGYGEHLMSFTCEK